MRNALLLSTLAALAACTSATEARIATSLPQSAGVQIGSPGATHARIKQGDTSDDYQLTYGLSTSINGSVAWVLDLVTDVVALPATSCTAEACTWGPGSAALDPNSWKLVVTKQSETPLTFTYVLEAEPKSNPGVGFLTILSGTAVPSGQPHIGSGSFSIDFDAAQKLDQAHPDEGQLSATYDNNGPLQISVTCLGCRDSQTPTQADNTVCAYADDSSGGGTLQVAVHNLTTTDVFTLESRWTSNGAGRGDLTGTTPTFAGEASECWSTTFAATYLTSNPVDPANPPFGDPTTGCGTFTTAQYASIQAP